MAWLETKGTVFRIRFRYAGDKHLLALSTSDRREAEDALGRFESNLRLIERGVIDPPPDGADIGVYVVSGGRLAGRPSQVPKAARPTLAALFDGYEAGSRSAAKEPSTRKTERIHLGHLRRLLDVRLPLSEVTPKVIQGYVEARAREPGLRGRTVSRQTLQKEVGTLTAVWNKWGVPQGLVAPPPVANLTYPKGKGKPPFQTRAQIERQIATRKLTPAAEAELWEGLFLTLPEVDRVLAHVRDHSRLTYAYPMFAFAAHTGARRSEIRRALVSDFDFAEKAVIIRERKKDHGKEETYRTVPLSPVLEAAMRAWFADHPGGQYAICTPRGRPIADHYATKLIANVLRGSDWDVIPGWHCFRHSFVSNCAAQGIDQRLIDHWVGHTTEAMRRRYSHLIPAVSQAALLSVFGQA